MRTQNCCWKKLTHFDNNQGQSACSHLLFMHSSFDISRSKHDFYRTVDCIKKFCVDLRRHVTIMNNIEKMEMVQPKNEEIELYNIQIFAKSVKRGLMKLVTVIITVMMTAMIAMMILIMKNLMSESFVVMLSSLMMLMITTMIMMVIVVVIRQSIEFND